MPKSRRPTEDINQFKEWSDAQLAASNPDDSKGPRDAMNEYLLQQINERRELLRIAGWDENSNSDDDESFG